MVDWERVITWVLLVAIVVSVGFLVYFSVNPPIVTESYTEFYILGPDGDATGYPTNLTAGESGTVIVGVANHEHRTVNYVIVMEIENETVRERRVRLRDGETWEDKLSFTVRETGRQEVQFELYRDEVSEEPYDWLRLWV